MVTSLGNQPLLCAVEVGLAKCSVMSHPFSPKEESSDATLLAENLLLNPRAIADIVSLCHVVVYDDVIVKMNVVRIPNNAHPPVARRRTFEALDGTSYVDCSSQRWSTALWLHSGR